MKVGRKPGVTRRPIEYILVLIALVLIVLLLWSIYAIDKSNKSADKAVSDQGVEGTAQDIGRLTDEDLSEDLLLYKNYDKFEYAASPSNKKIQAIGNIYDQTEYPDDICSVIEEKSSAILGRLESRINEHNDDVTRRLNELRQGRVIQSESLTSLRSVQDIYRSTAYTKFDARQISGEQKLEARLYSTKIDEIIQARRQSFDSVRADFRSNIDTLSQDRRAGIDSRVNAFKNEVDSAFSTAKDSCSQGREQRLVKIELMQRISAARSYYMDSVKTISDFTDMVKQESKNRNSRLDDAVGVFEQRFKSIKDEYSHLN